MKTVLQIQSQSTSSDLTAVKINPELPLKSILLQFPLIIQNLALAFQLPSQVLIKNVPYGKIIETPFLA
jgi:hypothetical protein